MLAKCVRDQWKVEDLDWSVEPRALSADDERAIVQYFVDMAAIERLAKALFEEQRRRATDPTLKKIFATFVVDEERHAVAAERLAEHYNRRRLQEYRVNRALERFRPPFLHAISQFSAEVANVYITSGELLLDIALLRSIDDYVDDEMSHQVMHLINRDESRHIAIDYYMVEYYASPAYQEWLAAQPRRPLRQQLKAWSAFLAMLWHMRPFAQGVFLEPMARVDPGGRRLREAVKRAQLLSRKPDVARRPFTRFVNTLRDLYQLPGIPKLAGPFLERVAGVPGDLLTDLYTDAEVRAAKAMSYDELADDALAAKAIA